MARYPYRSRSQWPMWSRTSSRRTIGYSGTVGVMQLHPDVAKSEFGADADTLRDPATNIRLGLRWLARLHERYDEDWELALSHYRGGELAKDDGRHRAHTLHRRLRPASDELLAALSARPAGACMDSGGERRAALRLGRGPPATRRRGPPEPAGGATACMRTKGIRTTTVSTTSGRSTMDSMTWRPLTDRPGSGSGSATAVDGGQSKTLHVHATSVAGAGSR